VHVFHSGSDALDLMPGSVRLACSERGATLTISILSAAGLDFRNEAAFPLSNHGDIIAGRAPKL
jgi:hypothetical protein